MPPRLTTDINWTTFASPVVVNYNTNGTVTLNGEEYKRYNQNPFWIDLTNGNLTKVGSDSVDVGRYHRDEAAKSAAARWSNAELIIKDMTMEESINSVPLYKIEIDYYGTTIKIETTCNESYLALKDIVTSGKTIYDLAAYCAENRSRVTWCIDEDGYCNRVSYLFMNALEKKEPEVNESDWKSLFAATSAAGS